MQPQLETEALDTCILIQCLDEEPVMLSQDVAEVGSEYEVRDEASSCPHAHHGLPHREGHLVDHSQNELGTDLQWDWADTAAGAKAGRRPLRGSQEVAAAHRRHTWAEAVQHLATQYGPAQRPESGRTQA